MKLLARFNLVFIAIFGVGTLMAVWFAYMFLRSDAKEQVLEQAKLMMETTLATRSYTTKQIKPLLNQLQRRDAAFLPQTVPAYSAVQVFNYIHAENPDYSYKEATLNPTNLEDRASDWEADVVNSFRSDATRKDLSGERNTPLGMSLFYARPIRINDTSCLECHSTPDRAPRSMIRQYGSANGFGWKLHEVVGAQIVSVPEALPIHIADRALKSLIAYLVIVALIALSVLDAVLVATVIRPVAKLSRVADEISQGKLDVEDIPIKGRDEISILAASFNRMKRSLVKAMRMLEGDEDGPGTVS
jgi:HAMP domain-containing protein